MFYKGEDAFPLWQEWVAKSPPHISRPAPKATIWALNRLIFIGAWASFPLATPPRRRRRLGLVVSSRRCSRKTVEGKPGQMVERLFHPVDHVAKENYRIGSDPNARISEHIKPEMSGEQMVPIIESIACDIPRTFIVNIPNSGNFVPGVPSDFAVNTRSGQRPRHSGHPDRRAARTGDGVSPARSHSSGKP